MVELSPNLQLRRSLSAAIAWQLISQIVRRYGGRQAFAVLEMHPGGGTYDLLTLWRIPSWASDVYAGPSEELLSLNLLGNARRGDDPSARFDWLSRWLQAHDVKVVVDELVEFIGLPQSDGINTTSRPVFGVRFIADLLQSFALDRRPLTARMGFDDTSGYQRGVPPVVKEQFSGALFRETDAARWWLLYQSPSEEPLAVVSTDGWLVATTSPTIKIDLFQQYQKLRSMRAVVQRAIQVANIDE